MDHLAKIPQSGHLIRFVRLTIVSEAVPLTAALSIEFQYIVVDTAWWGAWDLLVAQSPFECIAAEGGLSRLVQGPVEGHSLSGLDLGGSGSRDDLGGEQIQSPEGILGAIEAPGVSWWSVRVQGQC